MGAQPTKLTCFPSDLSFSPLIRVPLARMPDAFHVGRMARIHFAGTFDGFGLGGFDCTGTSGVSFLHREIALRALFDI